MLLVRQALGLEQVGELAKLVAKPAELGDLAGVRMFSLAVDAVRLCLSDIIVHYSKLSSQNFGSSVCMNSKHLLNKPHHDQINTTIQIHSLFAHPPQHKLISVKHLRRTIFAAHFKERWRFAANDIRLKHVLEDPIHRNSNIEIIID